MIRLKIETNPPIRFSLPSEHSEVVLGDWVEYMKGIEPTKPKTLSKYEDLEEKERDEYLVGLSVDDIVNDWGEFYARFLSFWGGIEFEAVANCSVETVRAAYFKLNETFAKIFSSPPQEKESFDFEGEKYYYPQSPNNPFLGGKDYMKGERMIDLVEAGNFSLYADKVLGSDWAALPYIIAILCKKKGESLPMEKAKRERWLEKRAKKFERLPMLEALNAAFFLLRQKLELRVPLAPISQIRAL